MRLLWRKWSFQHNKSSTNWGGSEGRHWESSVKSGQRFGEMVRILGRWSTFYNDSGAQSVRHSHSHAPSTLWPVTGSDYQSIVGIPGRYNRRCQELKATCSPSGSLSPYTLLQIFWTGESLFVWLILGFLLIITITTWPRSSFYTSGLHHHTSPVSHSTIIYAMLSLIYNNNISS